jgi:hypothetical protein
LANGIKTIQFRKRDIDMQSAAISNKIPVQQGHLSVKNAVMTSFRRHDNSIELRMFNPYSRIESAEIKLLSAEMKKFHSGAIINLEGMVFDNPIEITNGSLTLKLKPKQILTIRLSEEC